MVVLYELHLSADGGFKLCLVEAFEEEAAIIPKHLGLDENEFGDGERGGFHQKIFSFSTRKRY